MYSAEKLLGIGRVSDGGLSVSASEYGSEATFGYFVMAAEENAALGAKKVISAANKNTVAVRIFDQSSLIPPGWFQIRSQV